jgi:hypothetical protein
MRIDGYCTVTMTNDLNLRLHARELLYLTKHDRSNRNSATGVQIATVRLSRLRHVIIRFTLDTVIMLYHSRDNGYY